MSLISGNNNGVVVWSDSYRDLPQLPSPSRVQRCPSCGKYYFLDGQQPEVLHDKHWEDFGIGTMETGVLDYAQSFEALSQFEGCALTEDQEKWLHQNLLFSFNDWRTREKFVVSKHLKDLESHSGSWAQEWRENAKRQLAECQAREVRTADMEIFRINSEWLMSRYADNRLFHAELFREMGDFDRCLSILDEIGDDHLTRQFRQKAEAHDPEVFRLHFDETIS